MAPETSTLTTSNLGLLQNNLTAAHHLNGWFLSNLHSSQPFPAAFHGFSTPQSTSFSSTSDEADEQELRKVISERKLRRMISNRESARRSRMRKQRHMDELWSYLLGLQNENQNLIKKLNQVTEIHDRILQENTCLKREAYELHQMLSSLQLESPYKAYEDLEEIPCNTAHLRAAESLNGCTKNLMDDLLL